MISTKKPILTVVIRKGRPTNRHRLGWICLAESMSAFSIELQGSLTVNGYADDLGFQDPLTDDGYADILGRRGPLFI